MSIYEKLSAIQAELKAPKNQFNSFGNYNYRSCEDILEVAKPLCAKHKTVLILTDTLVNIGDRYYVKASAQLHDFEDASAVEAIAFAREEESKKGMDGSQVTGASSSYARKYALNGLFNIDDVKDSDFTNVAQKEPKRTQSAQQATQSAPVNGARPASKPAPTNAPDGDFQPTCADCGEEISVKVHDYSVGKYKKPLCMKCQKSYAR